MNRPGVKFVSHVDEALIIQASWLHKRDYDPLSVKNRVCQTLADEVVRLRRELEREREKP